MDGERSVVRVWLEGWQWGCCGDDFAVGDTVTWRLGPAGIGMHRFTPTGSPSPSLLTTSKTITSTFPKTLLLLRELCGVFAISSVNTGRWGASTPTSTPLCPALLQCAMLNDSIVTRISLNRWSASGTSSISKSQQ